MLQNKELLKKSYRKNIKKYNSLRVNLKKKDQLVSGSPLPQLCETNEPNPPHANWKGTKAIFKPLFVDDYVKILSTDFKMVVNFPTHIYFIVAEIE